jgi:hypothetical protein
VFLDHIDPIFFLPLVHTIACIPQIEYLLDTFRIGNLVWVDLLSPTVMSYRTSLPSLCC